MSVRIRGQNWHYQFIIDGTAYRGVLHDADNKTKAKELEAEEKHKARLGVHGKQFVGDDFADFVKDVYLEYSRQNKISYKHDLFRCKILTDYFAGRRFREIPVTSIISFIRHRSATPVRRFRQRSKVLKPRSPVTVHKEFTLLKSIFRMAIRDGVTIKNPCDEIPGTIKRLMRARNKRACAMTPEKERVLLAKGLTGRYAHLRPICLFDLHTGLRFGEITRLERKHVNLDHNSKWFEIEGEFHEVPQDCFIVVRSKNGKPRVIPMNAQARAVAEHQLRDATVSSVLFPSSKTDEQIKEVKKGLAGACKQAGIVYGQNVADGTTFHTLRHWFNSKLEELGVSKTVRRDLLGHEPGDITDDYTHSTIEMRRRAVERLCHDSGENLVQLSAHRGKIVATA